jgi:hypothetical protein
MAILNGFDDILAEMEALAGMDALGDGLTEEGEDEATLGQSKVNDSCPPSGETDTDAFWDKTIPYNLSYVFKGVAEEFKHPDDRGILFPVFNDINAYADLNYSGNHRMGVGADRYIELCFKVPDMPICMRWPDQVRFIGLCVDMVWNLLNTRYGDKGQLVPGAYIVPRFGIKDGVRDQLHISAVLSRWRIPYTDKMFALGLRYESELNRILKSVHALSHPILDDDEKIRAVMEKAWVEKGLPALRKFFIKGNEPLVSLGLTDESDARYGVYIADPSATEYKLICFQRTSIRQEYEGEDEGSTTVKHRWKIFTKSPGEKMTVQEESIADGNSLLNEYMLEPRVKGPFGWKAYGFPKMPYFRDMLLYARLLGVKERMKETLTMREDNHPDYRANPELYGSAHYRVWERPFAEVKEYGRRFRELVELGDQAAIREFLRQFAPMCPVKREPKEPYEEIWLSRFYEPKNDNYAALAKYGDKIKNCHTHLMMLADLESGVSKQRDSQNGDSGEARAKIEHVKDALVDIEFVVESTLGKITTLGSVNYFSLESDRPRRSLPVIAVGIPVKKAP